MTTSTEKGAAKAGTIAVIRRTMAVAKVANDVICDRIAMSFCDDDDDDDVSKMDLVLFASRSMKERTAVAVGRYAGDQTSYWQEITE